HRRDRLRATKVLQDQAFANDKIDFAWNSIVDEIIGDTVVKGVRLSDSTDPSKKRTIDVDGVFIFTGNVPNTGFVRGLVACDKDGFIKVDAMMRTSAKGIFACGDCTEKLLRQVVTACGDGATAAFASEQYIQDLKGNAYVSWEAR
ncbi:MAG TPA: FAD-dependent oxidoreductase, partial [Deltaproteobacteria bacterium]|nr:FAD-dependent oxidoreductase [Deltaproteobacteria bacterium]